MSETLELPNKIFVPKGWNLTELGDLFEFKNGVNAGKESYGIGTKFINVMEIIYNEMITADIIKGSVQITKEQIKLYAVKDGDIIFNRTSETTNEIGLSSVYFGDEDVVFGGFVIRATSINNELDRLFKKYCLRSNLVRNQIIKGGQGVVRSNIGQGDLSKIKLLVPPYNEQEKIAKFLGSIDDAINISEKLISKKEKNKKWLMQQLLTGKKRLKRFDKEWQEFHLNEVFTERNETKYFNLPLLSVGSSGIYPQSDSIKKDSSNEDKSKYKRICVGDIGYNTMRMWQGRSALSNLEGIVSPAYTIVIPKKNASSLFFSYLFKTPKLMSLFWRNSQGLVDDTLNCKFKDFSKIKLHLPELEEQKAIANILQTADKEIKLLKEKVEKLKKQKKGMMQVLLTGKKRLK